MSATQLVRPSCLHGPGPIPEKESHMTGLSSTQEVLSPTLVYGTGNGPTFPGLRPALQGEGHVGASQYRRGDTEAQHACLSRTREYDHEHGTAIGYQGLLLDKDEGSVTIRWAGEERAGAWDYSVSFQKRMYRMTIEGGVSPAGFEQAFREHVGQGALEH